ncbi:MAG TPA: ATP-binding protein, partial [Myxococcales bacterium]|nr:ATP-binding protein [Myxococcales bacterium]
MFFRALDRRHLSPEQLVEGTGYGVAHLRNKGRRMDWDGFVQFMSNAGRIWSPEELSELGEEFLKSPYVRPFSLMARMLFDAVGFYRWVFSRGGGGGDQWFSCLDNALTQKEERILELEVRIRDGYRRSAEFFYVCRGTYRAMPRMLGLPASDVQLIPLGQSARYVIRVPPGGGWLIRAKSFLVSPFAARSLARTLKEANETLQQRYNELEAARSEIARNADQLHTINEAGKELSQHRDLESLGDAVSQMLYTRFHCSGLRLSLARHPGEALEAVRESGVKEGPLRSWDLRSGGELLGRIEAWRFADNSSGLFDGLVPWIGIALNNARSFAMVKEAQGQLEQRVADRTRELSETTAKLQQSVRQLTEMDQQKTQFFANASHELRTPLTLMLLPVETLLSGGGLPADAREKLDGVLRGGYRLLKLINDLLDLSKIEAGKMQLRMGPVDLSPLLEEVVRPWRAVLARRGITLQLELPTQLPMVADGERLEQVALNLVSNAVKHVPDGGRLTVGAIQDDKVRFWVENTGEPIDPTEVVHIFERFGQSSTSKARRFGTTGLGLPLVKDLVELHSGSILLHNQPGSVRFEVRLPARQAEGAGFEHAQPAGRTELRQYEIDAESVPRLLPVPPPSSVDPDSAADRPVLLLVEDNDDLRNFLAGALASDYQVLAATDGVMGLRVAREKHPDVVLSDLMMPEMDGMELCRSLKADPVTSTTPFVLLTARGDLNTKLEGLDTGADDFLVKPFHLTEVQSRLRTQLRIRRMSEQLAHAEKLIALGTVVAGVAHEVRNPLNGIINALIPVKEMVGGGSPEVAELVELALGAARRVELLTLRLLQQVRAGEASETDVDLQENVSLAIQLLQHKAVGGPRLVADFAGSVPPPRVFGDPSSLNQVWVNLIDNAIHAAGRAGSVRVSVRGEGEDQVVVEVSDDGPGIPSPLLKRIFDPFFTTKPVGEGTGLGLSVVRQVVSRHGGQINVQSAPG